MGVEIDEKFNWEKHIETICKKAGAGIGAIRRVRLLYLRIRSIQPYFDYCYPLCDDCGKLLKDKLQKFQPRAARVITGAPYEIRSADVLETRITIAIGSLSSYPHNLDVSSSLMVN